MLKILKFIPVQFVFFLISGILLARKFNFPPEHLFFFLLGLVVVFIFAYFLVNKQSKITVIFNILTYVIVIVVGMLSFASQTALNQKNHYTQNFQDKDSIQEFVVKVSTILKPNKFNYKYEAEIKQLNSNEVNGKLLLSIQKDTILNPLNIDDEIFLKAFLEDVPIPKNPGEFNYKKYLENKQIYHQLRIGKNDFFKLKHNTISIKGLAAKIRVKINNSLKNYGFTSNELAVINALLLGQRQTIDEDLLENYVNAGAVHILAVSGLHIGILLIILQFLLKPLRLLPKGKMILTLVSIIMLWMYAILAGLSPSIVRAVTMFSALVIGLALNRPSNIYNTLFISMLVLLLIHPFYIFEVGFQLSYLAVFFIVWLQPKISNIWKPKFKLVHYFWQLFAVSIAAQLGVGALSLYYFHQFPGLFFISNLVIIPVLGFILLLGIVVITLSLLNSLPIFLADGYIFIIERMNAFIGFIGQQESFIAENISISLLQLIVYYFLIITFFWWIQTKKYRVLITFLSVLMLGGIINIYLKYSRETSNQFIVFQKNTESLIGFKNGSTANFYNSKEQDPNDYVVANFLLKERIEKFIFFEKQQYLFNFEDFEVLIIDDLNLYKFSSINPTIIILQNSPKINLERVLNYYNPKLIIADGSNYKSFSENWKKTCLKTKTPFYNTLQKGAYIFEY